MLSRNNLIPGNPIMPQPQAEPAASGNGFMDWINSAQGRSLFAGAGAGLLAKMNDVSNPVVPTALQAYQQNMKQEQFKQLAQQVASADLTPAQKSFVQAAFLSNDPKMMETASKFLESAKPISVAPQNAVIDPKTGKVIYQNPAEKTSTGRYAGGQAMDRFVKELMDSNGYDKETATQAARAYFENKDTLPNGTKFYVSGIARKYADQVALKSDTAAGINQQRYGQTLDSLLSEGQHYLPSIKNYVGAIGKVNNVAQALGTQFGVQSPQYADYQYFTRTLVPSTAGEMMRTLGVNASDEQKKLYMSVINPVSWDTNYEMAEKNYNRLVDLFKRKISPGISAGASQINRHLQSGKQESSSSGNLVYNPATGDFE